MIATTNIKDFPQVAEEKNKVNICYPKPKNFQHEPTPDLAHGGWCYKEAGCGPQEWGLMEKVCLKRKLSMNLCLQNCGGVRQSPIDIHVDNRRVIMEEPSPLTFDGYHEVEKLSHFRLIYSLVDEIS